MRIAVIGSGISGLSASYFLSKKYKVDLFEKENQFGGHSYTVDIKEDTSKKMVSVDLGFIVFNKTNYPNLIKFFHDLNIDYEKSNMSFSVSVKNSNIEYSGSGLRGIFSNKLNLFNLSFLKMIKEIIYFYKEAEETKESLYKNQTLGNFLKSRNFSNYFVNFHIIPMVAAIWSMPFDLVEKMPMNLFLNFFKNHGLFKIKNRPQWYTVTGRSKTYVNKVLSKISGEYYKNYPINNIKRTIEGIQIYYGKENEYFNYDKVIIATHADDALSLIENSSEEEKKILSKFKYKKNLAIIHTDENCMPKNKRAWSSWNSKIDHLDTTNNSITYWLNLLQNLSIKENIFLTLNPFFKISEDKIFRKVYFTHPYYNKEALLSQRDLHKLQDKKNILFCGSYFGYGFHEDGIKSTLEMIKKLND